MQKQVRYIQLMYVPRDIVSLITAHLPADLVFRVCRDWQSLPCLPSSILQFAAENNVPGLLEWAYSAGYRPTFLQMCRAFSRIDVADFAILIDKLSQTATKNPPTRRIVEKMRKTIGAAIHGFLTSAIKYDSRDVCVSCVLYRPYFQILFPDHEKMHDSHVWCAYIMPREMTGSKEWYCEHFVEVINDLNYYGAKDAALMLLDRICYSWMVAHYLPRDNQEYKFYRSKSIFITRNAYFVRDVRNSATLSVNYYYPTKSKIIDDELSTDDRYANSFHNSPSAVLNFSADVARRHFIGHSAELALFQWALGHLEETRVDRAEQIISNEVSRDWKLPTHDTQYMILAARAGHLTLWKWLKQRGFAASPRSNKLARQRWPREFQ